MTNNFLYFGQPLYEEDATIFQHNAPIEKGNSGGGLFDKNGYLIAINSAGDPDTFDNKDLIFQNAETESTGTNFVKYTLTNKFP